MSVKIVVGVDGSGSGVRAIEYAKTLAQLVDGSKLLLVYVIEWSPFTFQTAEENALRHKRREEEISAAKERVVDPAVALLADSGLAVTGIVKHGDVAETLDRLAKEQSADQIVVGRTSEAGVVSRIFGSSTVNLVMNASVPVTVVS
ncbi:MAG: universal stress protein [Pseudomonadota bacterium]